MAAASLSGSRSADSMASHRSGFHSSRQRYAPILTEASISLPVAPGFYIVTIGKETFKIMVTK